MSKIIIDTLNKIVTKPHSPHVNQFGMFMNFLYRQGFKQCPRYLKTRNNRDYFTYITGDTASTPLPKPLQSDKVLIDVAKFLKKYHKFSAEYLGSSNFQKEGWLYPSTHPIEVICHNDFAPYNLIFSNRKISALIDFETASPGPRIWDVAYTVYRFAPLHGDGHVESFGSIENKIHRIQLFCDNYQLLLHERQQLATVIQQRLNHLLNFLIENAASDKKYRACIDEKHHLLYEADLNYIKQHENIITHALTTSLS